MERPNDQPIPFLTIAVNPADASDLRVSVDGEVVGQVHPLALPGLLFTLAQQFTPMPAQPPAPRIQPASVVGMGGLQGASNPGRLMHRGGS